MQRKNLYLAGFCGAVFIQALTGAAFFHSLSEFTQTSRWLKHTYEVLFHLEESFSLLKDVELQQKRYVITGEEDYLKDYTKSFLSIEERLQKVRSLTADNVLQQRQLDNLEPLIRQRLIRLNDVARIRNLQGFEAAQAMVISNLGTTIMVDIRNSIELIRAEEQRLLAFREESTRRRSRQIVITLTVGNLVSFGLLFFIFCLLMREVIRRKAVEERLSRDKERTDIAQKAALMGTFEWDIRTNNVIWVYPLDTVYGSSPVTYADWAKNVDPGDLIRTEEHIRNSMISGELSTEFRTKGTDDKMRWVHARGKVFYDHGQPAYMLGINMDITQHKAVEDEVKRLNEELIANNQKLAAANKELEAFSYSVSHDLRQPLRAVHGFCRMLVEECSGQLSEEGKRFLDIIQHNTVFMGQLIDDLLSFSRTGRQEMRQSNIDMTALAQEVWSDIAISWPRAVFRSAVDSLPPAYGDRAMLRQVMANLVSNACKFTHPRENPEIEISGCANDVEVIYSVKDNGVGFDMQYAGKLFGVFQRLHPQAEFEGTGVGLALAQRIIQRHGGRMWAESKLNEGATFYFTLPKTEG